MPLKRKRMYTFRIKVENKAKVAIIHDKTFIQLAKRSDGVFSKDYLIPDNINELELGITDAGKSTYEIIAKYKVE